ncbi:MAG: PKD domain-containing protein, partial [Flavobacteriales bacterium]|nr:PKD domain-containing protein [Flavobacteriales bacterium]
MTSYPHIGSSGKWRHVIIVVLLAVLAVFPARASHIIGGELYYVCNSGANYTINLNVYRDCNTGVAPFDNPAAVGVFDKNNNLVQTIYINLVGSGTTLTPELPSPCIEAPSGVCVAVAEYTKNVTLPPIPGGYTLAYQRCCRNATVKNVNNPTNTGATFTTTIPDKSKASCNSNPVYDEWPPVYRCAGIDLSIDHSATDADGDSLVYSLCTPNAGASEPFPRPQPPGNPPYSALNWKAGYSQANMMNGSPAVSVDAATGQVTGTPGGVGQYVIGICVSEYRNGIFLSSTTRDFQINVVNCPADVTASVSSGTSDCDDLTVSFTNNSSGATSYLWDFGDPTSTSDNSTSASPTWDYPEAGTYNVSLIAYSALGNACNDTLSNYVATADSCLPCDMTASAVVNNDANCSPPGCGCNAGISKSGGVLTIWKWTTIGGNCAQIVWTVTCAQCATHVYYYAGGCGFSPNGFCTNSSVYSTGPLAISCNGTSIFSSPPSSLTTDTIYTTGLGDATVTPTGGEAPYTYLWSDGQTNATATDLDAGIYTVTVYDNQMCMATDYAMVQQDGSNFSLTMTKGNESSCSANDGWGKAQPSTGGTFTYLWTPGGATTQTASNLSAGTYYVFVDKSGTSCDEVGTVTITESNTLVLTPGSSDLGCYDDASGEVEVTPSGGSGPYDYLWYPGDYTESAVSGLDAGTYYVTVTDNGGCEQTEGITITEPDEVVATMSSTEETCYGDGDGSATCSAASTGVDSILQVSTSCYDTEWAGNQDEYYSIWTPSGSGTVMVTRIWYYQHDNSLSGAETIQMAMYNNGGGYTKIAGSDATLTGTGASGWISGAVTTPFQITLGSTYWIAVTSAAATYDVPRDESSNCGSYAPTGTGSYFQSGGSLDASVPTGASQSTSHYIIPGITYVTNPTYTYLWSDGQTNATAS